MTEQQIKTQLRKFLDTLTPGSLLSIMAELYHQDAEWARRDGDERAVEKCRMAEAALVVFGHGLDAILAR